jgi:hypothetical protein
VLLLLLLLLLILLLLSLLLLLLLQDLDKRGLVLVGHSFGGVLSSLIIPGDCPTQGRTFAASSTGPSIDWCESYNPPLATVPATASVNAGGTCSKITAPAANASTWPTQLNTSRSPVSNSVRNASAKTRSTRLLSARVPLRGAIAYEGYRFNVLPNQTWDPIGITVPPGMFFLYLTGQYNPNPPKSYQLTNTSKCSCSGLAQFQGLNHYGINDWQGSKGNHTTPCARPLPQDPPGFKVTRARQEAGLRDQVELVDAFIRSVGMRDKGGQGRLQNLLREHQRPVQAAIGSYSLQLKGDC